MLFLLVISTDRQGGQWLNFHVCLCSLIFALSIGQLPRQSMQDYLKPNQVGLQDYLSKPSHSGNNNLSRDFAKMDFSDFLQIQTRVLVPVIPTLLHRRSIQKILSEAFTFLKVRLSYHIPIMSTSRKIVSSFERK